MSKGQSGFKTDIFSVLEFFLFGCNLQSPVGGVMWVENKKGGPASCRDAMWVRGQTITVSAY